MKLYEFGPAPSARRVSLFLAEKKIDIERVHVDIFKGDNLTDSFKAKSLNGKIPLLEIDDHTHLCESIAICRYLDQAFPTDNHLFGDSPLASGTIEMWNRIIETQGLYPAFMAFRQLKGQFKDREDVILAKGEEAKKQVSEFLPVLEQQLSRHPYIAGDHFSVADITAYVLCSFTKVLGLEIDQHEAVNEWRDKVKARPAFQR
ncbi:glutathione S-transferase [Veronia nyctiphanis]|uniref:Glutathione S-transferase n=1 Tax=Veronia nyctiphanis TaxID=1278244 RepID=A0A4Q0YUW7_9GAMM|nr:glutathione S-transferase family protein [Veronia nyctiphanis]RXJ74623.1 glutathione S-transferase [Veronia nyctiphanis]